jgi:hypothetical protein
VRNDFATLANDVRKQLSVVTTACPHLQDDIARLDAKELEYSFGITAGIAGTVRLGTCLTSGSTTAAAAGAGSVAAGSASLAGRSQAVTTNANVRKAMIFFMVSSGAGWEFDRIAFRPAMRRKVPSANGRDATRGGQYLLLSPFEAFAYT